MAEYKRKAEEHSGSNSKIISVIHLEIKFIESLSKKPEDKWSDIFQMSLNNQAYLFKETHFSGGRSPWGKGKKLDN